MFNWMDKKFFIRVILILVIASFTLKLAGISYISDNLLLGLMAQAVGLIGLKSWEKIRKDL
jgi:membrane-anchored glycerophosphoryl diester phosphodiesterase (GDPDase)